MPKSKRDKVVPLTQTQKRGRERKETLVSTIRGVFDEYTSVYVFEFGNLRTKYMKDIRMLWNTSRFFLGKNKLMQLALGHDASTEHRENLRFLTKRLNGQRGLLFTTADEKDVIRYFEDFCQNDFIRANAIAPEDVMLSAGSLNSVPSMEPVYRGLGLPTQMKNGVVELREDSYLCRKGEPVTADQAKLLKLFGYKLEKFKLSIVCKWENGEVKSFMDEAEDEEEEEEEEIEAEE